MVENQIQHLIRNEIQLPSLPAVAIRILNIIQKDEAPLTELGKIISCDPALSAKMLRVANSSLFSCSREISNINRAMSVLGTNMIKGIALSFIIASDMVRLDRYAGRIEDFWRHSITAAVAAELLSNTPGQKNEDLFLMALLQDLGMLVTLLTKGEAYAALLDSLRDFPLDLTGLEKDRYGFDHQQTGYVLLTNWNLPESLTEPILYHHHPDDAPVEHRATARILDLADQLADVYCGTDIAEKARGVMETMVGQFGLEEGEALVLLDSVAEKSREIISIFDLDPKDIRPYSILLQQANAELEKLNLTNAQMILELQESKEKTERLARKLQDANNQLKELVYRDSLTGLYNHRFFHEALAKELSRATRYRSSLSLILFDLDDFKKVNDSFGHLAGDHVLTNIAGSVSSTVRINDIVARYGGDEFAILLPATNRAGAEAFTRNLRLCVEGATTRVEEQTVYVTISIGSVTITPERPGMTNKEVIELVDRCLYQSKRNGRNQVTHLDFHPQSEKVGTANPDRPVSGNSIPFPEARYEAPAMSAAKQKHGRSTGEN